MIGGWWTTNDGWHSPIDGLLLLDSMATGVFASTNVNTVLCDYASST